MRSIFTWSLFAVLALSSSLLHAETWNVDAAHSSVGFTVKHMMMATVTGYFEDFTANVELDKVPPTQLGIDATIQAASINTRNDKRDAHLRSADFFDAEKYPTITFKSKKFEKAGDGQYKLTGDLTMRGVTKEITLDVEGLNATMKDPWGNERTAAVAVGKVNREDYGLKWNQALEAGGWLVGKEVEMRIEVELVKGANQAEKK